MKRAKKTGILKKKPASERSAKKSKKYAAILVVSLIVIILASLTILGIGGIFNSVPNSGMWELGDESMAPVDKVSGKVNILILGVDNEGLRTDTIIVASYDATNGTINMLSIPRDTRMYIASKYRKINEAHAITQSNGKIKGPAGTIDAVTRLTGIPINYYVEFSFKAFRDTIDALGGINFDVPQRMSYQDPVQDLNINLSKGYQLLDGDKAEQLVRFRRYPEGDIKRVKVQQEFIQAVIDQKLNVQIVTKLPELYKALSDNVQTNLSLTDVIKYANSIVDIDKENVAMYSLPGQYSGSEYKASYWLPDMREIKLLVQNTFGYETKDITSGKPIANVVYGTHTTETLNPDDVVVLEQDKHKTSASDNSTSKTSESTYKEQNTEKTDSEEKKQASTNNTNKTNSSNSSDDEKEGTKQEPDIITEPESKEEEPEITEAPEVPVVKPLEGMESSKDFVRPGAN